MSDSNRQPHGCLNSLAATPPGSPAPVTRDTRARWWTYRCPVAEDAVVVLWLSQWNRHGPRARSRVRVVGGRSGLVPEHSLAVAAGGVAVVDGGAGR